MGERRRQHHHHHGQRHVHQREHHAERREHELHRLLDEPELQKHGIQEAVVTEDDDPRIRAHHLAQEQGRDDHDQDEALGNGAAGVHQRVGHRITRNQRRHRRQQTNPHRVEEHARIERLQERGEIVEREAAGIERARHVGPDAELQDGEERRGEADGAQEGRRHEDAEERTRVHSAGPPPDRTGSVLSS